MTEARSICAWLALSIALVVSVTGSVRAQEDEDRTARARELYRAGLDAGAAKIGAKVREEADELARALESESDERVVAEAADLVFHALVGLVHRGLGVDEVARELARRMGPSGHAEKAARSRP